MWRKLWGRNIKCPWLGSGKFSVSKICSRSYEGEERKRWTIQWRYILGYIEWIFMFWAHSEIKMVIFWSNRFMAGTVHAEDESTATLLGMRTRAYKFQPVADIKNVTNFELRFTSNLCFDLCCHNCSVYDITSPTFRTSSEPQWWLKLRSIMAILAQHDSTYEVNSMLIQKSCC